MHKYVNIWIMGKLLIHSHEENLLSLQYQPSTANSSSDKYISEMVGSAKAEHLLKIDLDKTYQL